MGRGWGGRSLASLQSASWDRRGVDGHHPPLSFHLGIREDLAPPHRPHGAILRLERHHDVSPGNPHVADGAILEVKRGDGEALHRVEQTLESLSCSSGRRCAPTGARRNGSSPELRLGMRRAWGPGADPPRRRPRLTARTAKGDSGPHPSATAVTASRPRDPGFSALGSERNRRDSIAGTAADPGRGRAAET